MIACSMLVISVSAQISEPRLQTAPVKSTIRSKTAATVGRSKRRRKLKINSANRIDVQTKPMPSKIHKPKKSQNEQTNDAAQKAGTFDGDLRRLPQTKPRRTGTPKVREPNNVKPEIYVNEPTVDSEPNKF